MRFGPRLALLSIWLLLAASVPVAGGASGAAAFHGPTHSDTASLQSDSLAPETVNLTLQLQRDGDARWVVETTFLLRTNDERQAFDRLATSFERGDADVSYDVETFRRASTAASEATGRSMQIRGVNRSVTRDVETNYTVGRLHTTFTWTNFSRTSGDRLVVDDAFNTTSGTWLPGLATDQRLVISPPSAYTVTNAPPTEFQGGNLVWTGPVSFSPGYLDITFQRTGDTPTRTPTPEGPFDPATLGLVAAIVVGIGALALAGYVWTRREDEPVGSGTTGEADTGAAAAADAGRAEASTEAVEEPQEEQPEEAEAAVDIDLLSDEERVEYLLEQRGGRMKQANIVKETGWSNAKVSQLLSSMEEEGRIDKLRIGRENLITLPDEDIADFDE